MRATNFITLPSMVRIYLCNIDLMNCFTLPVINIVVSLYLMFRYLTEINSNNSNLFVMMNTTIATYVIYCSIARIHIIIFVFCKIAEARHHFQ